MNTKIILAVILLIGLFLRTVNTTNNPPALYGDELTIVLDANSILKTGQDQLGNPFPLTFQMGAGRPPGYVYGTIPFVALFGPSALSVRALSILSGLGIITLLYCIGRKLFSKKLGLVAAGIGAVSIWDISLSRGGFEAHFALLLALLGFYLFTKAKEKPLLYIFSFLSFGITLHTYPIYKVTLIPFLALLFWYQGGIKTILSKNKKYFFSGLVVLAALGILSLSQTFVGGSEKRFSGINIFSQEELKSSIEQKVNLERTITDLPESISKYFHNKPIEYSKVLIENYLQNFSLDFLILYGDRNPRHNMATMGQLYFAEMILIFIGLLTFWQKYKRVLIFFIIWIILAPIPTAIIDLPHALRSSFMLPPLIILSALGLTTILNQKNRIILVVIVLFFTIQFIFFAQKLYFLAPNEYSNFWSYSAKLASEIAVQNKNKYDYVILSDRIDNIEFAYPVYTRIDPKIVISQNEKRTLLNSNMLKRFDNVYIGYIPESQIEKFINSLEGSVLYIGPAGDEKFLNSPESINGLDGLKALVLEKKGSKL